MSARDPFRIEGTGCWCPSEMTLGTLRIMGHTEKCSQARLAWKRNYESEREMGRQKRIDEEVGRQVREAAKDALEAVAR